MVPYSSRAHDPATRIAEETVQAQEEVANLFVKAVQLDRQFLAAAVGSAAELKIHPSDMSEQQLADLLATMAPAMKQAVISIASIGAEDIIAHLAKRTAEIANPPEPEVTIVPMGFWESFGCRIYDVKLSDGRIVDRRALPPQMLEMGYRGGPFGLIPREGRKNTGFLGLSRSDLQTRAKGSFRDGFDRGFNGVVTAAYGEEH